MDRTAEMPRGERTLTELPYLRAWRLAKMVSQDELVEKTGIAKATLSRLENRKQKATFSTIGKIADALSITRQQLAYERPTQPAEGEGQA
jgi:transcriptional regulator with XRE-family HTH domain